MSKSCVVCGSPERGVAFREHDVDILACRRCGHVYSSWEADPNYDGYFGDARIESADQHYWDQAHRPMYAAFARRFLEGRSGRLLDVGCGLGYFVRHAAAVPGWQAYGREISQQAVGFAQTQLGLSTVSCGRVEDTAYEPYSFDIITLWDVIEHIPDPHPLLGSVHGLLRPGGLLFMHTPNVRIQLPKARLKKLLKGMRPGVHYLEPKDHMNIYSASALSRVLERSGFRDIRYTHLPPIQSVAGNRNPMLRLAKNAWFLTAVVLFHTSAGRLNIDNLFVAARPGPARRKEKRASFDSVR